MKVALKSCRRTSTRRSSCFFRPHLEVLDDRLLPGDGGWWAVLAPSASPPVQLPSVGSADSGVDFACAPVLTTSGIGAKPMTPLTAPEKACRQEASLERPAESEAHYDSPHADDRLLTPLFPEQRPTVSSFGEATPVSQAAVALPTISNPPATASGPGQPAASPGADVSRQGPHASGAGFVPVPAGRGSDSRLGGQITFSSSPVSGAPGAAVSAQPVGFSVRPAGGNALDVRETPVVAPGSTRGGSSTAKIQITTLSVRQGSQLAAGNSVSVSGGTPLVISGTSVVAPGSIPGAGSTVNPQIVTVSVGQRSEPAASNSDSGGTVVVVSGMPVAPSSTPSGGSTANPQIVTVSVGQGSEPAASNSDSGGTVVVVSGTPVAPSSTPSGGSTANPQTVTVSVGQISEPAAGHNDTAGTVQFGNGTSASGSHGPLVIGTTFPSPAAATAGAESQVVTNLATPTTALTCDASGESAAITLFSGNRGQISSAAPSLAAVFVAASSRGESPVPRAEIGTIVASVQEASPVRTSAQRKALALGLRYLFPDMTDDQIARAAGVSRRTLFRWAEYTMLKKAQREQYKLPRGCKDKEGNLEAWTDEDE
jgi:hypothetical protein